MVGFALNKVPLAAAWGTDCGRRREEAEAGRESTAPVQAGGTRGFRPGGMQAVRRSGRPWDVFKGGGGAWGYSQTGREVGGESGRSPRVGVGAVLAPRQLDG